MIKVPIINQASDYNGAVQTIKFPRSGNITAIKLNVIPNAVKIAPPTVNTSTTETTETSTAVKQKTSVNPDPIEVKTNITASESKFNYLWLGVAFVAGMYIAKNRKNGHR